MTETKANLTTLVACLALGALSFLAGQDSIGLMCSIPALVGLMMLIVAVQWVAFIPAWINHTEKFYDLVGTQTYVGMAVIGLVLSVRFGTAGLHHYVLVGAVGIWGLRLGLFLYRRVHEAGKDGRFDTIKFSFPRFFMVWVVLGTALWVIGFAIEVVSDRQKAAFRAAHPDGEQWIDEGLWALAQHPNYFGEMLLWTGLCVTGFGFYEGMQWLALLSPVFVFGLLRYGSGVPLLQERAIQRWGDQPNFQRYLSETNLLIPLPRRRSRPVEHEE
jgi:steroid 5-alpha reductase family enzyme